MPNRLPVSSSRLPTQCVRQRMRRGVFACLAGSLLLLSGCAKLPPSQTSNIPLSGKRLVATLRFRGPINPRFHYYFLINYDTHQGTAIGVGDDNSLGPVPVLGPGSTQQGYGNGFATGPNGVGGFTDFVRFEGSSYRLFHVVGEPSLRNFQDENAPVSVTLPNSNNGNPNVLQFEIDLAQLVVSANGAALSSPTDTVTIANKIKFLQVNVVATDVVPVDPTTVVNKQVDSLGNNLGPASASGYLRLNVSDVQRLTNQDFVGSAGFEPSSNDVYTNTGVTGDDSLDLLDYTIAITKQ